MERVRIKIKSKETGNRTIVLLVFFFSFFYGHSQVRISGIIKDSLSKPIAFVSVRLLKGALHQLIAYSITNNAGYYSINADSKSTNDSLYVEVSAIGYASQSKKIQSSRQNFDFVLTEHATPLPELKVKNSRSFVRSNNDTTSYLVDSFKTATDRSIGDVLKRMPGISVSESGKIAYNGKSISNFYIDGDNLLDDRYNIATNTISADLVDKVQILENHQPIKALKDISVSDDVALNVSLKENAKLAIHGSADLAGGYSNGVNYAESIAAMAFRKRYKAINTVAANNIGIDPLEDVVSHNFSDYLKQLDYELPNQMLRIGNFNAQGIDKRKYLFNNSVSLNANNLFKIRKDVELKLNTYFINDRTSQNYNYFSYFFLPADTVLYTESQALGKQTNNFLMQASITRNVAGSYAMNKLTAEIINSDLVSGLKANSNQLTQNLADHKLNLSNEFSFLKTSKKNLVIEFFSFINFMREPQTLSVSPGLAPEILNDSLAYANFIQRTSVPTFFSNNYISVKKGGKHFLQSYKMGFFNQRQLLSSSVSRQQYPAATGNSADSFINNLHWNQFKFFEELAYSYVTPALQVNLSLPLSYRVFTYYDPAFSVNNSYRTNRLYFNPVLRLKWLTGGEDNMTTAYNFSSRPAGIEEVFKGKVVENYQLLADNHIVFGEKDMHNFSIGYNHKNTFKLFFLNVLATYSLMSNDYLPAVVYYRSMQQQGFVPLRNQANGLGIFGGVSKLFSGLHSTISLRGSFRKNTSNQLQNGILATYDDIIRSFTFSVNAKPFEWLYANYSLSLSSYKSSNAGLPTINSRADFLQQNFEIVYAPKPYVFIKLKGDSYNQQQASVRSHYTFLDGSMMYKIKSIKTDFSLDILNIANIGEFKNVSITANNYMESAFRLRPRMLVLKAYVNF